MSFFIIPRNDRNEVGMTQEWLEMSFLIIPRNDRNDVGMMVRLIQCPFLSFLSFMIFLLHSLMMSNGENEEWRRMNDQIWPLSLTTKKPIWILLYTLQLKPIGITRTTWVNAVEFIWQLDKKLFIVYVTPSLWHLVLTKGVSPMESLHRTYLIQHYLFFMTPSLTKIS